MVSMTAVELGADTCALARTKVRRGEVELLAAETLDPAAFSGIDAFTSAVRQTRKALKLPRRCRAVIWGLPDGATRQDPAVKHLIAPLTGAGFRVQRVMSPCNALAALARLKMPRGDGATCWLAINRTGVATVVVRPGKQLYSHSFAWNSNVGSSGSQARLLQRYSLVAFLAPEIRRAMNAAREKGAPVDAIVTCGNLPEIRSLTMPLIEELDVEVESLDSLEGLIVQPEATDRLSDVAASLRIACAGAIARPTRRRDESKRSTASTGSLARVAAAAVLLGVGFVGWSWWMAPAATPSAGKAVAPAREPPKQTPKPTLPPPTVAAKPQPAAPTNPAPALGNVPPKQDVNDKRPVHAEPAPTAARQLPSAPPVTTPSASNAAKRAPARAAPPPVASDARKPPAEAKSLVVHEAPKQAPKPAESRPPVAQSSSSRTVLDTAAHPADKPDAVPARAPDNRTGASPSGPMPELLKDPVPRVTAILVSSDRHMATIDDGRIISVGEVLGKRVVVAIDERAVVLKEPSGVQIRVGLGGRILGVER
jgi:hypothetical protein